MTLPLSVASVNPTSQSCILTPSTRHDFPSDSVSSRSQPVIMHCIFPTRSSVLPIPPMQMSHFIQRHTSCTYLHTHKVRPGGSTPAFVMHRVHSELTGCHRFFIPLLGRSVAARDSKPASCYRTPPSIFPYSPCCRHCKYCSPAELGRVQCSGTPGSGPERGGVNGTGTRLAVHGLMASMIWLTPCVRLHWYYRCTLPLVMLYILIFLFPLFFFFRRE